LQDKNPFKNNQLSENLGWQVLPYTLYNEAIASQHPQRYSGKGDRPIRQPKGQGVRHLQK